MIRDLFGLVDRACRAFGKGFGSEARMRGFVVLELLGPDGTVKETRTANTVTTAGKTGAAAQVSATPAVPKWGWMAVGTGTPSGTLLGAEISRTAFSSNTSATNVDTVVATFGAGTGTGAITEAGTFDVVTPNTVNMWTSASFAVVNKGALDSLTVTWTLTFS